MDKTMSLLAVLSDETRLELVRILLSHDLCAGAVAHRLGISEAAVSQHIKVLRDAGLVTTEKRGRFAHHSVDRSVLISLARELVQMCEVERLPCDPAEEGCDRTGRCPSCRKDTIPCTGGCLRCVSCGKCRKGDF